MITLTLPLPPSINTTKRARKSKKTGKIYMVGGEDAEKYALVVQADSAACGGVLQSSSRCGIMQLTGPMDHGRFFLGPWSHNCILLRVQHPLSAGLTSAP